MFSSFDQSVCSRINQRIDHGIKLLRYRNCKAFLSFHQLDMDMTNTVRYQNLIAELYFFHPVTHYFNHLCHSIGYVISHVVLEITSSLSLFLSFFLFPFVISSNREQSDIPRCTSVDGAPDYIYGSRR